MNREVDWHLKREEVALGVEGWSGATSPLEEVGQLSGQGWRSRPTSSTYRPVPQPGAPSSGQDGAGIGAAVSVRIAAAPVPNYRLANERLRGAW